MQLRPYQEEAIDRLSSAIHNRPCLVAPTGSGKTVMAVDFIYRMNRPTLWITHRTELIDQAAAHLEGYGLWPGVIKSGVKPSPLARAQVASVQTLVRREEKPEAELIIIDEAHHARAQSYETVIDCYPGIPVVGLTATPFRLDGRGLGNIFGELVIATTTADLVDQGYLVAPKVYASKSPDLRGVKVSRGDYALSMLAERMSSPKLFGDIVETWKQRAEGKRTVAFAVNVEHSQAIVAAFQEAGVRAAHVDGNSPKQERAEVLAKLRSHELDVVSQCMILTEGWDLPSLECVIIARPTASLNLHLQMLGRVMRATDGKNGAICLDHAGNHHVHGLVTRKLNYTLEESARVGFDEPLGLRRCKACGLFFDNTHAECPDCGWKPEAEDYKNNRNSVDRDTELEEFWDDTFEYRRDFWNIIEAQRESIGYAPGWAAYRYKERFGEFPVLAGRDLVDPENASMEEKRAVHEMFLGIAKEKGFKPGWAAYRYRDIFGVWPRTGAKKANAVETLKGLLDARR